MPKVVSQTVTLTVGPEKGSAKIQNLNVPRNRVSFSMVDAREPTIAHWLGKMDHYEMVRW